MAEAALERLTSGRIAKGETGGNAGIQIGRQVDRKIERWKERHTNG